MSSEAHKERVKAHFDQIVNPCSYSKGDLVLVYDQAHDKLGTGKFKSMWHGPYIIKHILSKGAYDLIDYNGIHFGKLRNGIYLKKYYA